MIGPFLQDSTLAHALRQHADSTMRQQIFNRLDDLGSKLGVAVDHIWRVLVLQAYAQAAMNLAFFVLALIAFHYAAKHAKRWWVTAWYEEPPKEITLGLWKGKVKNYLDDGETAVAVGAVLLFIAACVPVVLSAIGFVYAIGYAINPEFFAFQQVIEFVRPTPK